MTVRGEAYPHHARDLALEIYRPVESKMRKAYGFSIDEFFLYADAAFGTADAQRATVLEVFAERFEAVQDMPDPEGSEARIALLLDVSDQMALAERLEPEQLGEAAGLTATTTDAIVRQLTIDLGSVDPADYAGPFQRSPLFSRPFVRHGGVLVLPVPGHLFRSPQTLFDAGLLAADARYSKHRAGAVDDVALRLLLDGLPGATGVTSAFYRVAVDGREERFETDGIVLFEDWCIIIEGKAGATSIAALRGDLDRLARDLERGLGEAWEQCDRVERYLRSGSSAVFSDERGRPIFEVPNSDTVRTVFVNPSLYPLAAFAHEIPTLRRLGMFEQGAEPWPILVTDLRVISEMLATPSELLHFIDWRSRLPIGDGVFVIDELDLLGAYMFGEVGREGVQDGATLVFGSATTDFDRFYAAEARGDDTEPLLERVMGGLLRRRINELAIERPRRWLDQSFAILDLSLLEAAAIDSWYCGDAYSDLGDDRWCAAVFGDTAAVALSPGIRPGDVWLEIGPALSGAKRRLFAVLDSDGPRIVSASRA